MARGRHRRVNQVKQPEAGQVLGPPLSEKATMNAMLDNKELDAEPVTGIEELQAEIARLKAELGDANARAAQAEALKSAAGGLDRPVTGVKKSMAGKTKTVRFVRPWKRYYPTDRAGFAPKLARALVEAGAAVYVEPLAQRAAEG